MKRIIEFFKNGIWSTDESHYKSKHVASAVRKIKLVIYTARGVDRHQTFIRSAALSFYTVMSLVPILALVFAVFKGFGFDTSFVDNMYQRFPQYSDTFDLLFVFMKNLLARTRGGVMAAVGFVVLLWSVVQVFSGVESAFNGIWEVKNSRSIARKLSDYFAVIFVVPILVLLSSSAVAELKLQLANITSEFLADSLYVLVGLTATWLAFMLIYLLLPNTKVRFKGAAVAGLIAGIAFYVFQKFYFYIQVGLSSYNAIYGTFAAVPLFLAWTQISWEILLFGGELSFAIQNVSRYEQEARGLQLSGENRRRIAVAAMSVIANRFTNEPKGTTSSEDIASELELPLRIVRDVLFDLENAGLVMAVTSAADDKVTHYLPSRDVSTMTLADVVLDVDCYETSTIELDRNPLLRRVGERLANIEKMVAESSENVPIKDLMLK